MFANAFSLLLGSTAVAAVAVQRRAAITDFTDNAPMAWNYPSGRGFAAASATDAPCGGFPVGDRTPFPLVGGDMAFTQRTDLENVLFLYTNESDPSRFHAFSTYTNQITELSSGHYCNKAPDFASLGFKSGDDATLLAIFQLEGASTYYYQCADVSLVEVSSYTAPTGSGFVCGNYTTEPLVEASSEDSMQMSATNGTGTNPHASDNYGGESTGSIDSTTTSSTDSNASSSSSSNSSGLSAAAGGGIGAAVAVVVLVLAAAAAYAFGYISFGRKKVRSATADDSSSATGIPTKQVQH